VSSSPNSFEVPADRPHLRIWPRRLPYALAVPETSLWFNVEVTAARYPDKAAYVFFGRGAIKSNRAFQLARLDQFFDGDCCAETGRAEQIMAAAVARRACFKRLFCS